MRASWINWREDDDSVTSQRLRRGGCRHENERAFTRQAVEGRLGVSRCQVVFQRTHNVRKDTIFVPFAVDLQDKVARTVERKEWFSLDRIDLEAMGDDLLGVITPTFIFSSRQEASSQLLAGDIELDHGLELNPSDLSRQFVCLLRLSEVARKAIEHIPALATGSNN